MALGLLLATSALSLSGCSALGNLLSPGSEQRDDKGTIVDGGNTDVFTIKVGDCLADEGGETVTDVPTVACDQPHTYEVYADTTLDAGDFPGDDALTAQADDFCIGAFGPFVGTAYEDSALDYSYYYPTEDSWNSMNDRAISCIITDPQAETVSGTLAGAAR